MTAPASRSLQTASPGGKATPARCHQRRRWERTSLLRATASSRAPSSSSASARGERGTANERSVWQWVTEPTAPALRSTQPQPQPPHESAAGSVVTPDTPLLAMARSRSIRTVALKPVVVGKVMEGEVS